MTIKRLAMMAAMCAGLSGMTTAASAQEWWNPNSWFRPAPVFGFASAYPTSCPNGVCTPNRAGYRAGYLPPNTCGPNGCPPRGYNNNGYGYRAPRYAPVAPDYRAYPAPAPVTSPAPGSNYRGPVDNRPAVNPFYE